MKRIICIGNRLRDSDGAGPAVHDRLAAHGPLPDDVELLDGGLLGLGLLPWIESAERVVFVDGVQGFAAPGEVVALDATAVAALADATDGHAAGLPYLLRCLPLACPGPLPELALVGIEQGHGAASVERAAALALRLAVDGADAGDRERPAEGCGP